jgi:hypothetical protein
MIHLQNVNLNSLHLLQKYLINAQLKLYFHTTLYIYIYI